MGANVVAAETARPRQRVPRAARCAARDRARGMGSPFGSVVGECRSDLPRCQTYHVVCP